MRKFACLQAEQPKVFEVYASRYLVIESSIMGTVIPIKYSRRVHVLMAILNEKEEPLITLKRLLSCVGMLSSENYHFPYGSISFCLS